MDLSSLTAHTCFNIPKTHVKACTATPIFGCFGTRMQLCGPWNRSVCVYAIRYCGWSHAYASYNSLRRTTIQEFNQIKLKTSHNYIKTTLRVRGSRGCMMNLERETKSGWSKVNTKYWRWAQSESTHQQCKINVNTLHGFSKFAIPNFVSTLAIEQLRAFSVRKHEL